MVDLATPTSQRRILLQKENIVTHDRTWSPGRLQPPQQRESQPYGVYLGEYEQYLQGLQHMKRLHLTLTRRDPARAAPVTVSRGVHRALPQKFLDELRGEHPAYAAPVIMANSLEMPKISFGSIACLTTGSSAFATSVQGDWLSSQASESVAADSTPTPSETGEEASSPSNPRGAATRRAARRRQRAARKLRKLETRRKVAELTAQVGRATLAVSKVNAALNKRERAQSLPPRPDAVVGVKLSSRMRRHARRAAARDSARAETD